MGPFPRPSSRCPANFSCSVRHPSAPPAGAPFLFREAGCLCVETKPVTFAAPFFVRWVPPAALADGQNHGSFRGLGEQQRARQETPSAASPPAWDGRWEGVGSFPLERTPSGVGGGAVTWDMPPGAISLPLFREHLVETPRARNGQCGAGFGGLSDTGSLLPSEIPCTGACAPSAILDHAFPCYQWPSWALGIKQRWALLHNCKCSIQNPLEMESEASFFSCVWHLMLPSFSFKKTNKPTVK